MPEITAIPFLYRDLSYPPSITFKIVGGILFWVVSFILGNKLAEMLEEDTDPPAPQSRPAKMDQEPQPAASDFSHRHKPTHHLRGVIHGTRRNDTHRC